MEQIKNKRTSIKIKIITKSNVLMGGVNESFEIGGVDKSTVRTQDGKPYIPASAFKGVFRKIVTESCQSANKESEQERVVIENIIRLLENDKAKAVEEIDYKIKLLQEDGNIESDRAECFEKRKKEIEEMYDNFIKQAAPINLLGIDGYQRAPKLLFSDFYVVEGQKDYFSIDSKNSIEEKNYELSANPRTYRTIRKGVEFTGEILLYQFERFEDEDKIIQYIEAMLEKFNAGFYRIGNSKSRGYGRIEVKL